LLKLVLRRVSVYAKQVRNFVPHFICISDRIHIAQEPDPITNGVYVLYALDNSGMVYAWRSQLKKVVIFRANDSPHVSCALQMERVVSAQRTANDIDAPHAQLRGNLR